MTAAPLGVRQELTRKAIHLIATAAPLAYAAGVPRSLITIVLIALTAIAALVEIGRRTSPSVQRHLDRLVGRLFRPHERASITGATWLMLGMLAAIAVLPKPLAVTTMWAAAGGDPMAAIVGRPLGRIRFASGGKSVEGALACLTTTAVGAVLLADMPAWEGVIAGTAAAIAEWPRWQIDDNVRVSLAVGGVLSLLRMFAA